MGMFFKVLFNKKHLPLFLNLSITLSTDCSSLLNKKKSAGKIRTIVSMSFSPSLQKSFQILQWLQNIWLNAATFDWLWFLFLRAQQVFHHFLIAYSHWIQLLKMNSIPYVGLKNRFCKWYIIISIHLTFHCKIVCCLHKDCLHKTNKLIVENLDKASIL